MNVKVVGIRKFTIILRVFVSVRNGIEPGILHEINIISRCFYDQEKGIELVKGL